MKEVKILIPLIMEEPTEIEGIISDLKSDLKCQYGCHSVEIKEIK